MLKLIIPGVLIQAVLIKFGLQLLTTVRVPLIQTVLTLFLFEVGAIALQQFIAQEFAKSEGLGALTTYTPWTLFFSVGMTVAILIFEGSLDSRCRPASRRSLPGRHVRLVVVRRPCRPNRRPSSAVVCQPDHLALERRLISV